MIHIWILIIFRSNDIDTATNLHAVFLSPLQKIISHIIDDFLIISSKLFISISQTKNVHMNTFYTTHRLFI